MDGGWWWRTSLESQSCSTPTKTNKENIKMGRHWSRFIDCFTGDYLQDKASEWLTITCFDTFYKHFDHHYSDVIPFKQFLQHIITDLIYVIYLVLWQVKLTLLDNLDDDERRDEEMKEKKALSFLWLACAGRSHDSTCRHTGKRSLRRYAPNGFFASPTKSVTNLYWSL